MSRRILSEKRKSAFKQEFETMMSTAPTHIYALWKKEGAIDIQGRIVTISLKGFEQSFYGELADEFVRLMNYHGFLL